MADDGWWWWRWMVGLVVLCRGSVEVGGWYSGWCSGWVWWWGVVGGGGWWGDHKHTVLATPFTPGTRISTPPLSRPWRRFFELQTCSAHRHPLARRLHTPHTLTPHTSGSFVRHRDCRRQRVSQRGIISSKKKKGMRVLLFAGRFVGSDEINHC